MCAVACLVSTHTLWLPSGPVGGWWVLSRLWCQCRNSCPPGVRSREAAAITPPAGCGEGVPPAVLMTLLPILRHVYDGHDEEEHCSYGGNDDASYGTSTEHGGLRLSWGGKGEEGNKVSYPNRGSLRAGRQGTGHGVSHRSQSRHCQRRSWRLCCRSYCSQ